MEVDLLVLQRLVTFCRENQVEIFAEEFDSIRISQITPFGKSVSYFSKIGPRGCKP